MDENKESKIEENNSEKHQHCDHDHHHGLKVALITLACLLVLFGVIGVAKMAFFQNGPGNRIAVQRSFMVEGNGFGGGRMMMGGREMRGGYGSGIIGTVTAISGDNLTVHKASNNTNYTVIISSTTQIREGNNIAAQSNLATGQAVTVQGSSNSSGQIIANFIIIN
jgi:hypothetical protein